MFRGSFVPCGKEIRKHKNKLEAEVMACAGQENLAERAYRNARGSDMKTIQANPDLIARVSDIAHANPLEFLFVVTILLGVACWKLKDFI